MPAGVRRDAAEIKEEEENSFEQRLRIPLYANVLKIEISCRMWTSIASPWRDRHSIGP